MREAVCPVPVDAARDKGNGAGHVTDSQATSRHRPQDYLAGGFNFIGT
jgi:hypothetical protein